MPWQAELVALDGSFSFLVYNCHTNSSKGALPRLNSHSFKRECMFVTLSDALASSQGDKKNWIMTGDWNLTERDMKEALKDYQSPYVTPVAMDGGGSLHCVSNVLVDGISGLQMKGMDNQHVMVGAEIALASSQSGPLQVERNEDIWVRHM